MPQQTPPGDRTTRRSGRIQYWQFAAAACAFMAILIAVRTPRSMAASAPAPWSPQVGIGGFSASLFNFVKTQEDDPALGAGGWQEADATLKFEDGRQNPPAAWTCQIKIGMPLRTEKMGKITPKWAAETSAGMATAASSATMHARASWSSKEFCNAWVKAVKEGFKAYKTLGARVGP